MSLAGLIAQGGAVAGAPDIAGNVLSGVQMGRQAQMQGLQADALRQENQARGLANLAAQRTQGDLDAVRQAQNQFTTAGPDGLKLDQGGYLASLAQGGRAGIGLSEQSRMQMQQLSQKEAQIADARRQHKALADVLYGVKGPMDFAAALPVLEKFGVDISTLRSAPFRNDWKDVLEQQINQGMDLESKLKQAEFQVKTEKEAAAQRAALLGQELNQQRFDLQMAQFQESSRHNRAAEGIGWANASRQQATAGGKAPAGYRYTATGDLEAIPGGPADTKKIAAEEKARADAQKATGFADMGIGVIDQLLSDPGLGKITGWASKVPIIPGTEQARADALAKQLEGQAFLQAFQSLKGGGAITNIEGEKATGAIARLQRAQSKADYTAALKDLRGVLDTGRKRAAAMVPGTTPAAAPAGPATRVYQGQTYTQNPDGTWGIK